MLFILFFFFINIIIWFGNVYKYEYSDDAFVYDDDDVCWKRSKKKGWNENCGWPLTLTKKKHPSKL